MIKGIFYIVLFSASFFFIFNEMINVDESTGESEDTSTDTEYAAMFPLLFFVVYGCYLLLLCILFFIIEFIFFVQ